MVAGCGNSLLSEDMVDDGFQSILATDFSRVVIDQQILSSASEYPEISYHQCNMTSSFLDSQAFEAIIDKGLYDAIGCAVNGERAQKLYIREVLRLLSLEGGTFILISHQLPEKVLLLLENHDVRDVDFTPWQVEVSCIPKPIAFESEELNLNDMSSMYFIYVCCLNEGLKQQQIYREEKMVRRRRQRMGRKTWKSAPAL